MSSRHLVIIPLYNEEKTIAAVIAELRRFYAGDVVIVNDGSTDGSVSEVEKLCDSKSIWIHHCKNHGYGSSLMDGFRFAVEGGYETAVTMDCDFQHEPCRVPEFFRRAGEAQILSGSRYLEETNGNSVAPPDRRAVNKKVTEIINGITGYGLTDAFCGFKGYQVAALKELALDESGYGFPLQFWIQAFSRGLTVKEIPVARIYMQVARSFGPGLDDAEHRMQYYMGVLDRELARCNLTR